MKRGQRARQRLLVPEIGGSNPLASRRATGEGWVWVGRVDGGGEGGHDDGGNRHDKTQWATRANQGRCGWGYDRRGG